MIDEFKWEEKWAVIKELWVFIYYLCEVWDCIDDYERFKDGHSAPNTAEVVANCDRLKMETFQHIKTEIKAMIEPEEVKQ